jgi:hypothetical protein
MAEIQRYRSHQYSVISPIAHLLLTVLVGSDAYCHGTSKRTSVGNRQRSRSPPAGRLDRSGFRTRNNLPVVHAPTSTDSVSHSSIFGDQVALVPDCARKDGTTFSALPARRHHAAIEHPPHGEVKPAADLATLREHFIADVPALTLRRTKRSTSPNVICYSFRPA